MSFVTGAYLGPYQALNIMFIDLWCNFVEKILHDQKLLTISVKIFITDVSLGYTYDVPDLEKIEKQL